MLIQNPNIQTHIPHTGIPHFPCAPTTTITTTITQAEYGDLYSSDNVMLTATHTHAAAGGYNEYFLYHITSWGFVKQSFDAMMEGILQVGMWCSGLQH
jgi:hypothetical protein